MAKTAIAWSIIIYIIFVQYSLVSLDANTITTRRSQLNRDLAPKQQTDSLSSRDEELIGGARSTKKVKSSLVVKHDDGCYDRIRLPNHIKPLHYDLVIEPEISQFTFQGAVAIDIETDMDKLVELNNNSSPNEQSENVDPNLPKKRTTNKKKKKDTTDEEKLRRINSNEIILHINNIDLINAWYLNDKKQIVKVKEACVSDKYHIVVLNMESSLNNGGGKVYMTFKGDIRDDMKGLYRSQYTAANGEIRYHATTQFQATEARSAFPCFDEPAFKATFDITLITPKDRLALANTHLISEVDLGDKRAMKFATSPLMSTYLVAFVIGEFDYIEGNSRGRPIRVYTALGKTKLGEFALNVALRSLPFLEDYFKIEFPLSKIDLVAIPDFDAGAMENWGLITYRETQLLIDEDNSSLMRKTIVAQTVAHELAHQWFGNLVTMFWWDDLWLNEGFATYMEYYVVGELFPDYNMMAKFINEAHTTALSEDASHSTHPIQASVEDPIEIDEIFDNISYFKGASVVRLLHEYLTDDVFRAGLRHYLSKNAYKNTVTVDLWDSFEYVSGKPVRDMMRSWTDQEGFPCLDVSVINSNRETTELSIIQKRFLSDGVFLPGESKKAQWIIPISIITGNNKNIITQKTILSDKSTKVIVKNDGQWIKLNPDFGGFYCVNYSKQLRESLYPAIKSKQLSVLDRMNLLSDAHSLTLAGKMLANELLDMLTYYVDEDDGAVWEVIDDAYLSMDSAIKASPYKEKFKEYGRHIFKNVYKLYGWDKKPKEPFTTSVARSTVLLTCLINDYRPAVEEGLRRFDLHESGKQLVDPSIRGVIYYTAAEYGSDTQYNRLFELYKETDFREEQNVLANAMANVEKRDRVLKVIKWIMSDTVRDSDRHEYLMSVPASEQGRNILWKMLDDNFDKFLKQFGTENFSKILRAVGSSFRGPITHIMKNINDFFDRHDYEEAERTKTDIVTVVQTYARAIRRDSKLIEKFLLDYLGGEPLKLGKKKYASDDSQDNTSNATTTVDSDGDTSMTTPKADLIVEDEERPKKRRVQTK